MTQYVTDKFLAERYGIDRSSVWGWVKNKPGFPQPIKLDHNCTRWVLAEIEAWEAKKKANTFRDELRDLINRHSMENGSSTPDFILAQYLESCLSAFDQAVQARQNWYHK